MSKPHLPAGKDPIVMASSSINFPWGSSFKGGVMSWTWRVPFPPLAAPPVPAGSQQAGGGPEPVPVPSPSWLSLDREQGHHPSASSLSCCPSWLRGIHVGLALLPELCYMPLVTWMSHRRFHSQWNGGSVQHRGITFHMEYSPLSCKQSSFWPRVFVTSFRSWFVSFLNWTCPSSEGGCHQSSPSPQQEPELLQWLPGSAGQSTVVGWRGEQEASCYFCNPSSLPNGLFSAPNGFCLTNGVSFLQRYDPGLVVVMVNLAVVIFYFQTELLLLSSVHQC